MNQQVIQDIHLYDELQTSVKLIELGFGEFQNLCMGNDFYYLPFQLISSGFERLMKCHICLGYHERYDTYPDNKYLKNCGGGGGHDLVSLKGTVLSSYFAIHNIPALREDFDFLENDEDLGQLIYMLSEFGKYARYHNLDIVTSTTNPSVDVKRLWEEYEMSLVKSGPQLLEKLGNIETAEEVFDYTKRQILMKLERFARAVCRQFTIGRLGKKALQYSPALYAFIFIESGDLGNRNYRVETTRYKEKERKPHKRTVLDEEQRRTNERYRYAVIKKADFEGDWPFYHDEVIIECREKYWCIVTIDNKDYALNGSAQGRYKLEDVLDAGMAIMGKSVGPFIEMALKLGEDL